MYSISRTKDFEKSYKRIKESGKLKLQARKRLEEAIDTLAQGEKLPSAYKDHQLRGELKDYRECHIKGDLLLVYQIRKEELLLVLVDMGTHSYLDF
jgi:mRNA interferase YafQ